MSSLYIQLPSLRAVPRRPRGVGKQTHCMPFITAIVGGEVHLHCRRHRPRHAACWVAGAVLHAILEESERAIVEVEEEAHAVALVEVARFVVVLLAVAPEGAITSPHEPGGGVLSLAMER